VSGSVINFNSFFVLLVILQNTTIMTAKTLKDVDNQITSNKHVSHTCICWS